MNQKPIILGASIGNCVHVAGVAHFLDLAENEGMHPIFLGPAVPTDTLFEQIRMHRPEMVVIGYRLTPENVRPLLDDIAGRAAQLSFRPTWVFGGTRPVAEIARQYPLFAFVSDGMDDISDSIRFLRSGTSEAGEADYGADAVSRIGKSHPYPILRHHFGLPSLEDTIGGVAEIARAKVLDVVSIGPDQNAQQFFFRQDQMDPRYDGAGGVPLRSREDFARIKQAAGQGNFPLVRCYSGTADVFEYAQLLLDTIDNCWTAIPLCWYNELDGRGTRTLEQSIAESQRLIRWHAERGVPVEINEPHHWVLRDAHDLMSVVMAYISAYNAKKQGVEHYIAQYMFNVPNGISFSMDYARVLAMIELVETLGDDRFHVYRQTRAGLPLLSADEDVAKGQLAATTFLQMAVRPHIIHVVGYCEADHAATARDVIASCKIVKGVVRHTATDMFSIHKDEAIAERRQQLVDEAHTLLDFIQNRFSSYEDPLANPEVLAQCIKSGYLDAVHILKNDKFRGILSTKLVDGKYEAYDRSAQKVLRESERIAQVVRHEAAEKPKAM